MPLREVSLVVGETYHIFSKSIASFRIFNNEEEFLRAKTTIRYYQWAAPPIKFSRFIMTYGFPKDEEIYFEKAEKLVQIVAYSILPTHIHFVLKQLKQDGISNFMRNLLNSYSHYFNLKHNRKGPLWESRFKSVLVETNEQLLHLTRYIHLNPVTAYLVDKPEDWLASSYKEYVSQIDKERRICEFEDVLNIEPVSYEKFVLDLVLYQRELAKIKRLLFE